MIDGVLEEEARGETLACLIIVLGDKEGIWGL